MEQKVGQCLMGRQTKYQKVHWYISLLVSIWDGCCFSILFGSASDEDHPAVAGRTK